ncbi:MAG: flavin-containing monooxygenase [Candidatus Limnocylindria bacterium]
MTGRSNARAHDVVVIGAGQAGLAAGYHLKQRGLDFVILEASARVGDVWRHRYDSLLLYSPARDDALPGMPFPEIGARFPTGRQMAGYLETYAEHQALPVHTGVRVTALRGTRADTYSVEAGSVMYEADQVIVATGAFQRPYVPAFAAHLDPSIRQLHADDYRNPGQLTAGPVLVVGVSHSGSDVAFELAATRRTYLSGRGHGQLPFPIDSRRARVGWPVVKFVARNVLTLRTPIGRKMAPFVRLGGGPLLRHRRQELLGAGVIWSKARTAGVRDGKPLLDDGQVLDVASVVWCTGYRPDYGWIQLPVLDPDGWPVMHRGAAVGAPGLYFLGVPFLSGITSMLVLGAGRDAEMVVKQVATRTGRPAIKAAAAG